MPINDKVKELLKNWNFDCDKGVLEKICQEAVAVFLEQTEIELEILEDGQIMARLYDANFDHYKEAVYTIEKLETDYIYTYSAPCPLLKNTSREAL